MRKIKNSVLCLITAVGLIFNLTVMPVSAADKKTVTLKNLPAYSGEAYVELNDNIPGFSKSQLTQKSYEKYSKQDKLGRCGTASANLSTDTMPTEERGSIGAVKPTGWHTVKYDIVDGKYLYNRCHLIGYQLSGENANEENLITGTRYMNTEGMLPFENMVADYIEDTGNHVLYRVTPVFKGNNLLASGVQMEAYSVEDNGKGICFNVYCYNVQPGIEIDYSDGDSELIDKTVSSIKLSYSKYTLKAGNSKTFTVSVSPSSAKSTKITWYSSNTKVATVNSKGKVTAKKAGTATITAKTENGLKATCKITVTENTSSKVSTSSSKTTYILNTNTKKFHYPSCSSVDDMKESNKKPVSCSREEVISDGYVPCKRCNP
ncbi:MAG: DNA/RNA non-specific endonuclease [Oscillospiraceae bacterium]|nr:DNA/RNA non-specific endonuclease [Oscillospiraceae bacterium]